MKRKTRGLVYSTETGRLCAGCGQVPAQCSCARNRQPAAADGVVRISRQTKGRKGAGVSVISGLPLSEPEMKTLAKELKQRCGTGGTVKNGVIEIQGDHRQQLLDLLVAAGHSAKLAGG
ncbi:MAG: translation initiation factor Sui1 [Desulfopila sp.]